MAKTIRLKAGEPQTIGGQTVTLVTTGLSSHGGAPAVACCVLEVDETKDTTRDASARQRAAQGV